jgi:hypothetical protein
VRFPQRWLAQELEIWKARYSGVSWSLTISEWTSIPDTKYLLEVSYSSLSMTAAVYPRASAKESLPGIITQVIQVACTSLQTADAAAPSRFSSEREIFDLWENSQRLGNCPETTFEEAIDPNRRDTWIIKAIIGNWPAATWRSLERGGLRRL